MAMAEVPAGISAADAGRLLRALGPTALCAEAHTIADELSPDLRAAFVAAVERATEAGSLGAPAIWHGLEAAARAAAEAGGTGGTGGM